MESAAGSIKTFTIGTNGALEGLFGSYDQLVIGMAYFVSGKMPFKS